MNGRASLAALVLVAAALVPFPAGAAAEPDPTPAEAAEVVMHEVPLDGGLRGRILGYWTPERMTHALPRLRSEPQPRPHRARQRLAAPRPSASSRGAVWPARGRIRATTGKVFFTMRGRDYLCSAGTVKSANKDTVVTAGHCVKDGTGAWAENWIFVPGYRDGTSPYGGFPARRMFVGAQWSHRADDDYDVAMVALDNAHGTHVTDAVGAQAIAFGRPRGRLVYGFGYPNTGRYDGERLVYCSGRPRKDPHGLTSGQGLRCDMTQGSSGGPWLTGFDTSTGTGTVTSVSSFKYADDTGTMYGPYFGEAARRLYHRAQRG